MSFFHCSDCRHRLPCPRCRGTQQRIRHRVPPLRGNKSPPAGEALLQPLTNDCVTSGLDDPDSAAWCKQYPGSESPWSLPGCVTFRALLSTGPDPPVFPTGSALRIPTPLLEGSSTSATPGPPGDGE